MYPEHIQAAAREMADNMKNTNVPVYGADLRLPDRKAIIELINDMRRVIFPAYFGDTSLMTLEPEDYTALMLERIEESLTRQAALALPEAEKDSAQAIARDFIAQLPRLQRQLLLDVDAIYDGDLAARSKEEVIFAYPGLFAIFVYRVAHELYLRKVPILPRMMTEYAHSRTGIDIHPGANIGEWFFIDHGTGIVIGETTDIGDRVKLYQGVTLGALSPRNGHAADSSVKRHPTVESGATIYSGASILGGDTTVGANSVVGGNAFLTTSVAPNTKVVIQPPETIYKNT